MFVVVIDTKCLILKLRQFLCTVDETLKDETNQIKQTILVEVTSEVQVRVYIYF